MAQAVAQVLLGSSLQHCTIESRVKAEQRCTVDEDVKLVQRPGARSARALSADTNAMQQDVRFVAGRRGLRLLQDALETVAGQQGQSLRPHPHAYCGNGQQPVAPRVQAARLDVHDQPALHRSRLVGPSARQPLHRR